MAFTARKKVRPPSTSRVSRARREPVAGSDAMGAEWVHPDDLGPRNMWKETLRIIEMSAARRRETA